MKAILITSLLGLAAIGAIAQQYEGDEATRRQIIHEKAVAIYCRTNGNMGPGTHMPFKSSYSVVHAAYPDAPANAVPARPEGEYTALQEPPCYKYLNARGREIMECPGARFTRPQCSNTATAMSEIRANGNNVSSERSFSGYYPALHSVYPQAPKSAVAAWPQTPYREVKNPPCYKYVNRKGLEVTECPGAYFEPEHK